MRGRQIPLGGRVAARPVRPRPAGADPLASRGWRDVRASDAGHRATRAMRPRRRVGRRAWLALVGLLLLGVAALAVWLATTPALRARQLRVEGTSDAALISSVRALPLTGCFVFACDTTTVVSRVEALPQVASARAWLGPPSTLVVRVTPRVPVLVWRAGGSDVLVGRDGVVIGPATKDEMATLSVVDDPVSAALPEGKAAPGTKLPASLVELAAQLRSSLPALLGAQVSLSYDATLGLVADDSGRLRVVFGDPSRPPADQPRGAASQLDELRAILRALAQSGQRATLIDLRWGTHPAYRLG